MSYTGGWSSYNDGRGCCGGGCDGTGDCGGKLGERGVRGPRKLVADVGPGAATMFVSMCEGAGVGSGEYGEGMWLEPE